MIVLGREFKIGPLGNFQHTPDGAEPIALSYCTDYWQATQGHIFGFGSSPENAVEDLRANLSDALDDRLREDMDRAMTLSRMQRNSAALEALCATK